MKKATLATLTGSGIAVLALLSVIAQADSVQHSDLDSLELDMAQAAIAATEVIPGDIIEAELEMEHDSAIWEIDIVNATNQVITIEIDGETGQILSTEFEDDTELKQSDALSLAKAINIVRTVENGALIDAGLEHEHGQLIWEVEAVGDNNQETKFRIDAKTGEILI